MMKTLAIKTLFDEEDITETEARIIDHISEHPELIQQYLDDVTNPNNPLVILRDGIRDSLLKLNQHE